MKKSIVFAFIFLVFSSFIFHNNNAFTDLVKVKLSAYNAEGWPEKVYVQTDKPYYASDETIWFTAYLVNGISHQKSTKSAVVYVELIDKNNILLAKKKLYINNVSTAGDIKINKEWKEGTYLLRAYTKYMQNGDPEYFFQKNINIWGIDNKEKETNTTLLATNGTLEKPELNFYPEGGHLVENITSKVAIKIKNDRYQNTSITGNITDTNGNIISEFKSLDFGLGLFSFTPLPKNTYYANIDLNGSKYSYELPKALPIGFNLSINYIKEDLLVNISSTKEKGLQGAYLALHQRGKILFDKIETGAINNSTVKLSTDNIPDGVSHITLFNSEGNPVCERLVFIENTKNQGFVYIKKDKEVLGTKEKISLKLDVSDFNGTSLPSHLSMSVRDLDAIPFNENLGNIKTWLLLNSDLRGTIKNPGYFFSKDANAKSKYLLDLVMMTNGWRRFTWQNLLYEDNKNDSFEVEKGIMISGKTKALEEPNPGISALTTLTFFGETAVEVPSTKSDSEGNFEFGPFIFKDSIQTIIQAKLTDPSIKKGAYRDILISLDEADNTSPKVERTSGLSTSKKYEYQLDDFKKVSKYIRDINIEYDEERQRLDEILIIAKKETQQELRRKEISKRSFFNSPTFRIDLETDSSLVKQSSILNLFTQFPGLVLTGSGITSRGGGNPLFRLNNLVVDYETISGVLVTDISFIDYYRGAEASLYSNSDNGVIEVFTKLGASGFSRNVKRKPGIVNFTTEGFYTAKEFFAPDYAKDSKNITKADVRSTLHWEPQIQITRQNQTAEISFYTCDIKGNYIIEIEGVSDSGIPLHQTSTFVVE